MSLFQNLTTKGLEESKDQLGGNFAPVESDIYEATIKALYASESKGGAMALNLVATLPDGKEYRETVYVTNKKKENFFVKDSKKQPLPGFTLMNELCVMATDKELHELETEEKVVRVYDFEAKAEVNKNVPMIVEAIGKKVALGILKQLEDKTKENPTTGEYEPTGETRETNAIDKVFHPELKVTLPEARIAAAKGVTPEPAFYDAWLKRNQGQVKDRTKGAKGGAAGAPPKAGAPGTAAKPKTSLFGK